MKGILLAAGYGTRLRPLNRVRAKPLLPVGDRPLAERLIGQMAEIEDLGEIIVVTNDRYIDQFRTWKDGFRPPGGRTVTLVNDGSRQPEERLGAMGDLALALEETGGQEDVLIAAGDNVVHFSFDELLQDFLARDGADGIMPVEAPSSPEQLRQGGAACVEDGWVTEFEEKPDSPSCDRRSASVFVFGPKLRSLVDTYVSAGENTDETGHFFEWAVDRARIAAFPHEGQSIDIGTLDRYVRAVKMLRGGEGR